MIKLGNTSEGNLIWFNWESFEDGRKSYIFPDFGNLQENFDAFAVYDLLQSRMLRSTEAGFHKLAYQAGFQYYSELVGKNADELASLFDALNIRQSIDRGRYARKLLLPEFRE